MKALSACLYCTKKKECADSVHAHSFTDSCFMTEGESIRAALEDLRDLSRLCPSAEAAEKINGIAETMVLQTWGKNALQENMCLLVKKQDVLLKYIADSGCELICRNAREYPCTSFIECYECDEQCECRECKDNSKFSINWDKLAELYPESSAAVATVSTKARTNLFTERNKII